VVVHADAQLIVCDKPAGLLAVPGRGEAGRLNLLVQLQPHWPEAEVVHRLDMATSGLIVFARGKEALRALSRQFAERRVHKRYVAVVAGRPEPVSADAEGWSQIDLPLRCDWPQRPRQMVCVEHGKPSRTRWRVLAYEDDTTRLALEPVTGRSHQLRVHLQAIGHPIVGDPLYAPPEWQSRAPRLLLHAAELGLQHPGDARPLCWRSAPPF